MTGWRLGWMLLPDDLVRPVDALAGNVALCPPAPAQYAAVSAFAEESYLECDDAVAEFARTRKLLLDNGARLGWGESRPRTERSTTGPTSARSSTGGAAPAAYATRPARGGRASRSPPAVTSTTAPGRPRCGSASPRGAPRSPRRSTGSRPSTGAERLASVHGVVHRRQWRRVRSRTGGASGTGAAGPGAARHGRRSSSARMHEIDRPCRRGDGVRAFNRMYLTVTELVRDRLVEGWFADSAFMTRLDVVFAGLYLEAVGAARAGPRRGDRSSSAPARSPAGARSSSRSQG